MTLDCTLQEWITMKNESYSHYWAEDIVSEMGHDCRDDKSVAWVLRWMSRNGYDPSDNSVVTMADEMKIEFLAYLLKRNL
jgi:hypothetical protein